MAAESPPRRRQARGERRMAQILDAAAGVFAEVGYEAATTNAIAAAANVSPGSLYQFYANKEAIAEALAHRFASQMRAAHEAAFGGSGAGGGAGDSADPATGGAGDPATLPLDRLLDRVIDPIVRFNVAHPGMKALLTGADLPERLAAPVRPLQEAVAGRIEQLLAARSPGLSAADRARLAQVSLLVFKAMLPPIVESAEDGRAALVTELKTVLHRYLAPELGG